MYSTRLIAGRFAMPTSQPQTLWEAIAITEQGREMMEAERERHKRAAALLSDLCVPTLESERYRYSGRPAPSARDTKD
jgi:hypothetical protein